MKNLSHTCKHAGLALVLTIMNLCGWNAPDITAQTKPNKVKVVVTMDSPSLPYDPENARSGRSNTKEIVGILKSVKGLSVISVATSLQWSDEARVRAKNPDLIIIHWSAFAASPRSNEKLKAEDDKFISFLRYMERSNSRILVYTRQLFPDQSAGYKLLINHWERMVPLLKDRIEIFEFVPGKPKRFRDPDVREALRQRVAQLLKMN